MNCKELAYMLADYIDGSMDPRLREELDAHLAKCEPCMAFTKTFQATCEGTRKLREAIEYAIPTEVSETSGNVRPDRGAEISRKDARVPGSDRAGPAGKGRGSRQRGDRREPLLGRGAPHGESLRRLPGVQGIFRRGTDNRRLPGRRSPRGHPVPPDRADAGASPRRGVLPRVTPAGEVCPLPKGILIQ